jgi:hypothetical protein
VLGVHDDMQKADAEALVFFPNPIVMSNSFEMRQIGQNPFETFLDTLSLEFYARTHGAVGIHCFADWDGSATQVDGIEPCLRPNDDDSRMCPGGLQNQVHVDGEMWSAFLTRLRPRLLPGADFDVISRAEALAVMTDEQHTEASDRMLHLLLSSHELLSPTAEFQDAIDDLLQAAVLTIDGAAEVSRAVDMIKATAAETTMPYSGAPYGG